MSQIRDRRPSSAEKALQPNASGESLTSRVALIGGMAALTFLMFVVAVIAKAPVTNLLLVICLLADVVVVAWIGRRPIMQFVRWFLAQAKASRLNGRWWPENPEHPWVEFGVSGTMTTATGDVARFRFLVADDKITLTKPDGRSEEWSVVSLEPSKLVVHASGKTTIYRKSLAKQAERLAGGMRDLSKAIAPEKSRAELLVGKWDLVGGKNFVQFTADGAMFRADGFVARYQLVDKDQAIELSLNGASLMKIPLMSLTKHELVLSDNGSGLHFQRGTSITETEMKKARDEFNAKLLAAGKTAATVAGGIGVGILAFGAVGAAASTIKGIGSPQVKERVCTVCDGKGWLHSGEANERRCWGCGGQGVLRR